MSAVVQGGAGTPAPIGDYSYDGLHRRISRVRYDSGGSEIFTRRMYYSQQWQVLEEHQYEDEAWLLNKQYVWGTRYVDELILRDNDLSNPPDGTLDYRHYALQDANFNVVAIVNNVGDVGRRFAYDAYGHSSTLNADFTPGAYEYDFEYRYAGYRWDYETQLLQVRNRWYHPSLGRWVSRDPIGYAGGTLNLYEYVGGSAVSLRDPFGWATPEERPNLPEGASERASGDCWDMPLRSFMVMLMKENKAQVTKEVYLQMFRGCIGFTAVAQSCKDKDGARKGPFEKFPELAKETTCYRKEAEARAHDCGEKESFIFARQGKWRDKEPVPDPMDGSVPNDSVGPVKHPGDFNYITLQDGWYYWINHSRAPDDLLRLFPRAIAPQ